MNKKDIPSYVRRCWNQAKTANRRNREAEIERLRFWVGGDLQWRDEEIQIRKAKQRPWITINRCKPAVDQVEGDIRLNPPGPEVLPVDGAADGDVADIFEGLIREVEYRSDAKTAYVTAGKYSAASGYAVLELNTEYSDDRSFAQRLRIDSVEDPSVIFFDPAARQANRQDAMWAGKIRSYSKEEYEATFGKKRRILQPTNVQVASGWLAEAMGKFGVATETASLVEWTGPGGQGPFYVCEFQMVEFEPIALRACSDHIARFADEELPNGVRYLDGDDKTRQVQRRKITQYIVDAFEVLDETDWLGSLIRWIPVLGPEVYIDGKLHRLSLISGAIDSQRALNYVATTATELGGLLPKAPFIGWEGQFDDPRWQSANSEMWAYLEVKPVHATDSMGNQTLLPAPQRNMWEAPIQWLLALATYFSDSIKATTAIYDASLGQQKGDQSGKAIQQLRSESNVGNISYSDNLHRAIGILYQQMVEIFPLIMDGPRTVAIVKPDSQHEMVAINQEFGQQDGKKPKHLGVGQYMARVTAGPSFETRQQEAIQALTDFFKNAPQALGTPGVAAKFLRMIGEGNPEVEGMADLLAPNQGGEQSPAQLQGQLQQATEQNKSLTVIVQKLQQAIQSKLPEIEARKWIAAVNALAGMREAEIKAGIDKAQIDEDALEHLTGMAHDVGLQAQQQAHEQLQAQSQQAADSQAQSSDQQAAAQQQEAAQQGGNQQNGK